MKSFLLNLIFGIVSIIRSYFGLKKHNEKQLDKLQDDLEDANKAIDKGNVDKINQIFNK